MRVPVDNSVASEELYNIKEQCWKKHDTVALLGEKNFSGNFASSFCRAKKLCESSLAKEVSEAELSQQGQLKERSREPSEGIIVFV